MKRIAYLVGAVIAVATFLVAHDTSALTLAPTYYEVDAKPGETITKSIRITNEETATLTLVHDTSNFTAGGQKGEPQFTGKQTDVDTFANWISVGTPQVTLAPGQRIDVPFTINVPADAEPGGHYAALTWGSAPSESEGNTVAISGQIASLILLNVEGEVDEGGLLQSFTTPGNQQSYQGLPVTFRTTVANTGNVHFKPQGQITIKNMFGFKVKTLPFNMQKDGGNILPKSVRVFDTEWDRGFAFGKYTAELEYTYGSKNKMASASYSFWVLPLGLVFVWLVILIILAVIIVMLIMRSVQRSGMKQKKGSRKRKK